MRNLILLAVVAMLSLAGCIHVDSGYSKQTYKTSSGEVYESTDNDGQIGISLERKPDRLRQRMLAEGELEFKRGQAEMLKNISNRQQQQAPRISSEKGEEIKVIGVVNNDPKTTCYFYHPQVPGFRIVMRPKGGLGIAEVTQLPPEVALYRAGDNKFIKNISTVNRSGKTYEHAGVKFNSFTQINEIYN